MKRGWGEARTEAWGEAGTEESNGAGGWQVWLAADVTGG